MRWWSSPPTASCPRALCSAARQWNSSSAAAPACASPRPLCAWSPRSPPIRETGETVQTNLVGVYTLVGGRAEFKPVEILTEESDFYVVSPATEGRAVLRAGDEVIVRATGLYDGKLLNF